MSADSRWVPFILFCMHLLLLCDDGSAEKDHLRRLVKKHCPVSHILDPEINGWFSYPVNIWAPEVLSHPNSITKTVINCTSIEINEQIHFDRFHKCISSSRTGKSFCPVHMQNFIDASKRSNDWTPSRYLCGIRHLLRGSTQLQREETVVNIIVLGGSVTSGQFTEGYYCKTCSASKNKDLKGHTNWAYYLDYWLKHNKMSHVRLHFLAVHGYSSAMMNEVIVDKLKSAGLSSLTESDIVLIDHSYNDGLYLSLSKVLPLQRGLEGLIRKLLELSASTSSRPRIVLLETLAYLPTHLPFYQDYQKVYTQIARHYRIPIWSIRDAANSEYSSKNQTSYYKYMKHDQDIAYDLHPG